MDGSTWNMHLMGAENFHEVALDHVEWLLLDWARWMRPKWDGGRVREASGCVGGGYTADFDDMAAEADRRVAKAVDAAIEDLGRAAPAQRLSIYITWGIAEGNIAVWRFRHPVADIYERAKQELVPRLKRRGIWLGE